MTTDKARRLGRGLDALLASTAAGPATDAKFPPRSAATAPGFQLVPVGAIQPNPLQPRRDFDPAELAELQASIGTNGLLQPVLVRPKGSGFELVAGERRLRAVQGLGWREVPAHVRELDDEEILTLALIENLQRTDLNPIEEAEGYQALIAKFSLTQQEVAEAVGRDRSTVANTLRLLGLPEQVRRMVSAGELSLGHARALLGLSEPDQMRSLATAVVSEGLTVRAVEQRVREAATGRPERRRKAPARIAGTPESRSIEESLRRRFQTDVAVSVAPSGRGEVRLTFYSSDDLERLLDLLLGPGRESV